MTAPEPQEAFLDLFAAEAPAPGGPSAAPWHVLLVDDEPDLHSALSLALRGLEVEGAPVVLAHADSAAAARARLAEQPDTALVLLDVVMESLNAGLDLVRHIRDDRGDPVVQIILVTGQPGAAPQRQVAQDYAINGYCLKAELTSDRVLVAVIAALRTYKVLRDLDRERERLRLASQALGQVMQELRESAGQLDAIYTLLPYLVVLFDRDGRYVRVNPAVVRTFGFDPTGTRREDTARRLGARFPDGVPFQPANMPSSQALDGHTVTEVEYLITDAGGQDHILLMNALPVLVGGAVQGVVVAQLDLTRQRQLEAEARILQGQFLQKQKMESLGILAGGVAHDMNNVLGAILALASAQLTFQAEGSPLHQVFETIASAANRGGKMVKSLLNFARQSPAEVLDVDLNRVLREDVTLLERTTFANIQLELDLDPELPTIRGDAGNLTHAIMNLCVNAVDAMGGRGTLTLRTRRTGADRVQVQVRDTGCGMAPDVLKRAMEPFFTTKEVGKGTGLGLAMVFSIMQAHEGTLSLESEPGRGTVVTLDFPASRGPAAPLPAAGPAQAGATGRLRVLLVDDDELIRSSTRLLLEALGHAVTTADSGEEALRLLAAGTRPELVLLDMNMPGWGGGGTLPRLRALLPGLPVLLTTGRADQTALDLVAAHPPMACLPKPFTVEELLTAIGGLVGGR